MASFEPRPPNIASHLAVKALCGLIFVLLALSAAPVHAFPTSFTWAGTSNGATPSFSNASTVCAPAVLNQENCGCCYAFSSATTIATSICAQLQLAGLTPSATAQEFLALSPQMLMNLKVLAAQVGGTTVPNPCNGGNQFYLINDIVQTLYGRSS